MTIVKGRLILAEPYSIKNGVDKIARDSGKLGSNIRPSKKENGGNIANKLDAK